IHLQFWSQPPGIDDGRADLRLLGSASRGQVHMARAGTMAPLAVDAPRERRAGRIPVVAEQAALVGQACKIGGSGIVGPGTHPPALLLRVPGQRQFGELAAWRLVQVRAGVIARADRKSRFLLEYVYFGAIRIQLMPALEDAAIAAQHLVAP